MIRPYSFAAIFPPLPNQPRLQNGTAVGMTSALCYLYDCFLQPQCAQLQNGNENSIYLTGLL